MALQLTIYKQDTPCYTDFENAYWVIPDDSIGIGVAQVGFALSAYPSREAYKKEMSDWTRESSRFTFGSMAGSGLYKPELYHWEAIFDVDFVFPNGIPTGRESIKTALYEFVKSYLSRYDWQDVYEESN